MNWRRLFRCSNEKGYFAVSEKCLDFCQVCTSVDTNLIWAHCIHCLFRRTCQMMMWCYLIMALMFMYGLERIPVRWNEDWQWEVVRYLVQRVAVRVHTSAYFLGLHGSCLQGRWPEKEIQGCQAWCRTMGFQEMFPWMDWIIIFVTYRPWPYYIVFLISTNLKNS